MVTRCLHNVKHVRTDSCSNGCNGNLCVEAGLQTTAQPPKPPRKRSAPLYGELLNQNKRLEIENHSLKITVDILKNAPLFGVMLWWFRNRKGGGK